MLHVNATAATTAMTRTMEYAITWEFLIRKGRPTSPFPEPNRRLAKASFRDSCSHMHLSDSMPVRSIP